MRTGKNQQITISPKIQIDKESQNRKSENDPSYLSWLFAFVSPVTGWNEDELSGLERDSASRLRKTLCLGRLQRISLKPKNQRQTPVISGISNSGFTVSQNVL